MIEGKIPSITGLATTSTLNAVENKILNVSEIVHKTGYDADISHINTKYFTASESNKFRGEIVNAKIKMRVVGKYDDISWFINNSDLDKKIEALN